ncbi:MAG TPA: hypothetical protein P5299_01815 [Candidatus Woesebacteria bacterium]|nr:hypothetical protein [Candidatus Woesebacteria bacterium]
MINLKLIKPILAYCLTDKDGNCLPNNPTATTTQLEKYLSTIIGFITLVGVIWFTFQIIFAGYTFLSSGGDIKKVERAQQQLMQSLIGIIVIIAATIIVGLIVRILGLGNIFDLNLFFRNLNL